MNTQTYQNAVHHPDISVIQFPEKAIDEVYCAQCHLATPTWRNRCIHCRQLLPARAGGLSRGRGASNPEGRTLHLR